jgi:ketol-acid reductoisomerase
MQKLLDEVKDGTFAKNWIAENRNGRPWFSKRRAAESDLQIETVGKEMRRMMPFLDAKEVLPGLRGAQGGASATAPAAKKSEKEVPVAGAAR